MVLKGGRLNRFVQNLPLLGFKSLRIWRRRLQGTCSILSIDFLQQSFKLFLFSWVTVCELCYLAPLQLCFHLKKISIELADLFEIE